MKSLLEYISEKLIINSKNDVVSISSNRITIDIPQKNINACARFIEKEIKKQCKVLNITDYDFINISIEVDDISIYTCDCIVNEPVYLGKDFLKNGKYYISPKHDCMNDIEPNTPFVKIRNTMGMLVDEEEYTDKKKGDAGYCEVSTDPHLNAYWIQHYARGNALNVKYDFKQIALALILDLSFQMKSAEMKN